MQSILERNKLPVQGTISIPDIVEAVSDHFCLPSIQRGVVWSKEDIASFFDSLYKGFPVGNILLWPLNSIEDRKLTDYYLINTKEDSEEIRNINSIKNITRDPKKRYCVIDGQQRITALYRGLNNKYIVKGTKYLLFFNVLYDGSEPSAFRYFSEKGKVEEKHLWVPVKEIWKVHDDKDQRVLFLDRFIRDFYENDSCYKKTSKGNKIRKTNSSVRKIDSVFNYYNQNKRLALHNYKAFTNKLNKGVLPYSIVDLNTINTKESSIEKLFDVFVRLNKNGRPLNPTDLLFAQIAKSSNYDNVWDLFVRTVRDINSQHNMGKESRFSQDNLLRFIWLINRQNNDSFNKFFMSPNNRLNIDQNVMDKIKKSFWEAKKVFFEGFFTYERNTPYSMFLPIAYYFYYGGKKNKKVFAEIQRYYELSLVSEAFSQGTDTVMSKIIEAFEKKRTKITLFGEKKEFDFSLLINKIKENGGDFFDVSNEKIEEILKKNFDNDGREIARIFLLLSRRNNPNISIIDLDHMHPKKYAEEDNRTLFFKEIGSEDESQFLFFKKHVNDFANLQLLDVSSNRGDKNDKPLIEWLRKYRSRNLHDYAVSNYVCEMDTPVDKPDLSYFELSNFHVFYENRKNVLRNVLKEFLGTSGD